MYFNFESDFVEPGIKCIPMIVRFKLDACGIKLKLEEWSRMTLAEREHFSNASCASPEEINRYKEGLQQLVLDRMGRHVTQIPVEQYPLWSRTDLIPDTVSDKLTELGSSVTLNEWQQLNDLQRFALVKLSRPGHENKNFVKAIAEFGLLERA